MSCGSSAESRERRRIYNRRYMRGWRERNRDRARTYAREYMRRTYHQRKISQARREDGAARGVKRCFNCGAVATETIERVDLRTWEPIVVAYCGRC